VSRLVGEPHRAALTAVLAAALAVALTLVGIRAASYAFTFVGLTPAWAVLVLVGSLLGSAVNIPVMSLHAEVPEVGYLWVRRGRVLYSLQLGRPGQITVAVNVGGAVIPTIVSLYLLVRSASWLAGLLTILIVALVVHLFAVPVQRVGIVVPMSVPPLTAAAAALLVGSHSDAAALAYVGGTLGTLVGADLSNFRSVRRMEAQLVSIGGGGTFDGIFVSGILAILLAAFV
jgi:uncharacterized membrane protein